MSKLSGMTGVGGRVVAALRGLPRMLREDLWTAPVDPVPPVGTPGSPVWRPAFGMLLTLGAAALALAHVSDLIPHGAAVAEYAVLLVVLQSLALVAGMWRPLHAWWASLILMIVSVRIAEPVMTPGELFPWTGPEIALQSGALFLLTLRVHPRRAVLALALTLLTGLASSSFTTQAHNYALDVGALTVVTAVVTAAALRALRVARTELVEQSELTEEERARRTLLEERNRIARELHDVVAHHMSVISIQAQVAPHLVENPSDELRENLAGIRENAVEALAELRRVLGVLRSQDAVADGLRHAPQPTLDRLDELIGKVRSAGVTVVTETTGRRRPLPPGVELSAFRIVQEALSNVLRHAPGARARVELGYRSATVTVRVTNTAPRSPGRSAEGVGHGLLGMRERAAMLGGELTHGRTPGGGYEVLATLPLEDPA
ncbi:sensor histidine kinase [Streptomyces sp. QL37]|uniref:sensor histidine kinase n=1 Tax=Streptomyces sp. QL37 TaxID=2093747 RepID=UPI000CF2189D|nr:sensor histidine kinase [Streptomyces sp. QL37]PPQ60926.1 two-component sensor histidine kinase [Streptomyces sp. QL37]